ncbi:Collagen alpha-2(I) chain [Paramuricea clavata]|uniref:Collagen alpha-2(I) chain n=1 Tax=Paramuricea clavata TaxID=317549 RepID=A0A7D9D8L0_PARCT|nr:Collagen alpha-2(I) chain [Paramuricea clavata]
MVTNTREKISDFGAIHTGISDHRLIFAIRKISVIKKQENIVEMRNMKNFNEENFVAELLKQHWEQLYFFAEDPNDIWNAKKDYYSSKIAGQKFNPKKAWKSINNLLGRQNKQTVVNEINLEGKNLQLSKILQGT